MIPSFLPQTVIFTDSQCVSLVQKIKAMKAAVDNERKMAKEAAQKYASAFYYY
jgi:hypothetical protein